VQRAARRKRPRKQGDNNIEEDCEYDGTTEKSQPPYTCVVCLETSEDATQRCSARTCATPVCIACAQALRGLCPICDRGVHNAFFRCAACAGVEPLQRSGHPCLECHSNTLCRTCYKNYSTCRECV
jgi:hypothetical protein